MPMASDPRIRASDADRDRVAALLREHHAAGRLTADEFNERLDQAYAARTLGELEELLADLPAIDLYQLPDATLPRGRRGQPGLPPLPWMLAPGQVSRHSSAWRLAWASLVLLTLLPFGIWLLTGHPGSLWLLWVAGIYNLILLGRWGRGRPPGRDRRRRRDR
jgi:hypothetical protein